MLSRLRHTLVLFLFCALPFHALFVTVGTKLIAGPGNAPLSYLALWKEAVIAPIFLIAIAELFTRERKVLSAIFGGGASWSFHLERDKLFIVGLLILSVLLFPTKTDLTTFVYGFKYVFVPLIFFVVLRTLDWEEGFLEKKVFPALLVVGGVVAGYGILTFFLPQGFFTTLGYSDAHSLYSPSASLSAFQQIADSGIRRIQGTFSGPNQMGLWLLVPWSISVVEVLRKRAISNWQLAISLLVAVAITLTFSRSAWIAAFIITLVACWRLLDGNVRTRVLSSITALVILGVIVLMTAAPQLLSRGLSNKHHLERTKEGVSIMFSEPLGRGLGTAGPAANRTSDPCVYFEAGANISWANDRDDLCLFVDSQQVQPDVSERACTCAFLPENWYVQIGVELGILGFLLFIALTLFVLKKLQMSSLPLFLSFLGVSIAALFLHAWEDSAVAYTVWGLVGIVLSSATHSSAHNRLDQNVVDS